MAWSGVRPARARGVLGARTSVVVCGMIAVAIAIFGKAEASIFDAARTRLSDMTGPALLEVSAPLVAFERWVQSVGTVFSVYRENIELRKENAELRSTPRPIRLPPPSPPESSVNRTVPSSGP